MQANPAHLREWRKRRDLSQERLGAACGVTGVSVHRWETGKAPPGTDDLRALALALGVPVEALLTSPDEWDRRLATIAAADSFLDLARRMSGNHQI